MALKKRFDLRDPDQDLAAVEPPVAVRGLTSADLLVLIRVLQNWLMMTAAVWAATVVVPGIVVRGGFATYLVISLVLGLVNAVLGPVLRWLLGSLSWLTLGVSALLANGLLLATTAGLSPNLDIDGFGSAVVGAIVVAVAGTLLELVVRPAGTAPETEPDV
jgi:putative membrane protein